MPNYAKINYKFTFSGNSDFSDPEWVKQWDDTILDIDAAEATTISIPVGVIGVVSAGSVAFTGGTTLPLDDRYDGAGQLQLFAIQNLDSSNYITVVFGGHLANGENAQRIYPGQTCVLTGVNVAAGVNLIANGAACKARIAIAGPGV